jgi:hypothetical protein
MFRLVHVLELYHATKSNAKSMQNTTKRSFKAGPFARASVNWGIVDSSLNFAALKRK